MDRSDSTSSTRNSPSNGTFAYQQRLLDRTSSLSRTTSLSKSNSSPGTAGILTPSGTGTRRWTPSHRIVNSVDSVRGKWEERVKAAESEQAAFNDAATLSRATSSTSRTSEPAADARDDPTSTAAISRAGIPKYRLWDQPVPIQPPGDAPSSPPAKSSMPPPSFKRHTLPSFFPPPQINDDPAPVAPRSGSPTGKMLPPPPPPEKSTNSGTSPRTLPDFPMSPGVKRFSGLGSPFTETPDPNSTIRARPSASTEALVPSLTGSSTSTTESTIPPSVTATPSSSYRSPSPTTTATPSTTFRSSYMATKANRYPDSLGASGGARKLGRHLPRIASGDGNEDFEEERRREEDREEQEARQRIAARERARQALEESRRVDREIAESRRLQLQTQSKTQPPPPSSPQTTFQTQVQHPTSPQKTLPLSPPPFENGAAPSVTGVPGRWKLSRTNAAPKAPAIKQSYNHTFGLWADVQRHLLQAYEYLCHVGEAQQWIEGCLQEELGFGVVEMDEGLRNGVVLAKLAKRWEGEALVKRIFEHPKLQYRHSDNINLFFIFVRRQGLPESFIFELTDLYEKKNIPKVIYCIHALSHLLARKGLAERIGNLVGQLQFSDEQLQSTQKGLSGMSMPNFKGVGRDLAKDMNVEPEPEPEPVESEFDRRARLFEEAKESIIQLQAQARGALVRNAMATQQARMQLAQRYIVNLQSRCRGVLARQARQEQLKKQMDLRPWAIALQATARGLLARRLWRNRITRIRQASRFIVKVQAQARGVLVRHRFSRLKGALRSSRISVVGLQALARAKIGRKTHQQVVKSLAVPIVMKSVGGLQAAARGLLKRREIRKQISVLDNLDPQITALQAHVRGVIVRRRVRTQLARLDNASDVVLRIQAACRAFLARRRLLALIRGLKASQPGVIVLQAHLRGVLTRLKVLELHRRLADPSVVASVKNLQALARGAMCRRRIDVIIEKLSTALMDVVALQAVARGYLVRESYLVWRDYLHSSQAEATHLQALMRGVLQRRKFMEKMNFYRTNMSKVIKIQSLFRAKEQREQYRQLTLGTNVTVGTIKNFVHLLDDSEADFEDEIEVERLRKKVVEGIRENQALETDVSELDVKISLLVQNVKSFEELSRARKKHGADNAAAHAARSSLLVAHGDPFAGSHALDQGTKRKLELYQQFFYLLQTHSEYLARLFFRLSRIKLPDKTKRVAERVVLTLFGYGQDRREEFLFLKLFQAAINEEINAAPTLQDVIRGHPMYFNIAVQYARPKQVAYVRDSLSVVINEVISQPGLDLQTDPVLIYRARLNEEETRTGRPSMRPRDVDYFEALEDPETRTEFIQHLQLLQSLTKDFVNAITASTRRMPYGMRCIARETLQALRKRFPDVPDEDHAIALGQLLYYRFLNPAVITPETFDIVPTTIAPGSRRNLAEISKMLNQIVSGSIFSNDNPRLTPLNQYVSQAIGQMTQWLLEVADVPEAEAHFHTHDFLDATVQPKPIYISPNEVYAMHSLIASQLDHLVADRTDTLRAILTELDGVPQLGSDELKDARDRAITLDLTNRFANVQDPHADEKALWVQAKRGVLAILRVQPAKDLVAALLQPPTEEHELLWEDIVDKELVTERMRLRKTRMPSTTGRDDAYRLEDIRSLMYSDVKERAIKFLFELEKQGKVTRRDGYQGILNAIAADVRSKRWKRLQRKQEMDSMNEALHHLRERKKHFTEQIDSYHSYVDASMETMQKGRGKKRRVMWFSKQWSHVQDLKKTGKAPQFGSFRYTAEDMYKKGILLSIDQTSPRQFDKIDVVISSDKAGVFTMEITDTHLGVSMGIADLRMEDLLQAQYENRTSLSLFDGVAKVNLNLLLYQINKKFYV